jgi:hydroxypyruvate isomerase
MIKQSFAWWSFVREGVSAEAVVEAAARLGYAGIDLAPEEYWPLIHGNGLTLSAVGGHGPLTNGLNRREHHARVEAEVLAQLDLAVKWSIPNLICFSGNRAGLDDATGAAITAEGLSRLAPAAEQAGVTLVIELLNSKVDHPDYQCDRTAWAVRVCELVGSPRVRTLYDIYHMQIMEGDLIRTIQTHHAWFAHYHTAGNPDRHDLDEAQEIHYPAVMRAVADTGYTGYVCHEFVPKGEVIPALAAAFQMGAHL